MEQCGPDLVPFSELCQGYGVIALAVSSAFQPYLRGEQELSLSPVYYPRLNLSSGVDSMCKWTY